MWKRINLNLIIKMIQFDILSYMSSLTGFVFEKSVLERIALERGVDEVSSLEELTQKDRDLLLADLLFIIYTSPTQSSSISKKHGSFSLTIGSQYISDKKNIYELMNKLYSKWGDEKLDNLDDQGLQWLEY